MINVTKSFLPDQAEYNAILKTSWDKALNEINNVNSKYNFFIIECEIVLLKINKNI